MLELSKIVMYVNVLVWLCKTKMLWESKIVLCGYRHFHCIHKNRWYLWRKMFAKKDVETRFDTSNYQLDRPLPIGKNKKVIGLMRDELDGKSWWNLLLQEQKL